MLRVALAGVLFLLPGAARPVAAAGADSLGSVLVERGFENVTIAADTAVAFENRRWRHSEEARGRAARVLRGAARLAGGPGATVADTARTSRPIVFTERRLGMAAAAVTDTGGAAPARVSYPSDAGFPAIPNGPVLAPTSRTVDLELRPRFTYELGRIFDPVLIRLEAEPALRYNPWPGARATASVLVPVRNDFELDPLHPDLDRTRPGRLTLEQYMWLPGAALISATGGVFTDNRYGISFGAARPLAQGAFLLDAQADWTGYLAFPATGTEYSSPDLWTGFAGITWRPPALDLGVRLRVERFLYNDRGAELELRRSMGDLDFAFFYQRTGGENVHGVRLAIPIPPLTRPTRWPVRPLPVERLPLEYQDEAAPLGRTLGGVASREEYLRQLSLPALTANAPRYFRGEGPASRAAVEPPNWVSLTGMTGFINTPWCGVMGDREVEMGYNTIPRRAAYDHRGEYRNDVYYAAVGFLPRLETGLRWTVIPGLKAFADIVPDSRLTDSDRMLSGRITLLEPRLGRPGLAVGIEDALGTRRFHSTYAVSGIPFEYGRLHSRLSLGYAPRALTASRYTLDGAFGAFEVSPWRVVAGSIEYDTERWNASAALDLGFGFRARVALLDLRYVSAGAGWHVAL